MGRVFAIRRHVAGHETISFLFPRLTSPHSLRERTRRHCARGSHTFVFSHKPLRGASNRTHTMPRRLRLVRVRRSVRHPRIHDGCYLLG